MDEEVLIQEDKREHPNCHYSQSLSSSCKSNNNSELVCKTLKRIIRHCPTKEPVDILSSSSSTKDHMDKKLPTPNFPHPFDDKHIPFGGIFNNKRNNDDIDAFSLFDIFDKFLSRIDIDDNQNHHQYQVPKHQDRNYRNHPGFPIIPHKLEDEDYNQKPGNISGPIDKV